MATEVLVIAIILVSLIQHGTSKCEAAQQFNTPEMQAKCAQINIYPDLCRKAAKCVWIVEQLGKQSKNTCGKWAVNHILGYKAYTCSDMNNIAEEMKTDYIETYSKSRGEKATKKKANEKYQGGKWGTTLPVKKRALKRQHVKMDEIYVRNLVNPYVTKSEDATYAQRFDKLYGTDRNGFLGFMVDYDFKRLTAAIQRFGKRADHSIAVVYDKQNGVWRKLDSNKDPSKVPPLVGTAGTWQDTKQYLTHKMTDFYGSNYKNADEEPAHTAYACYRDPDYDVSSMLSAELKREIGLTDTKVIADSKHVKKLQKVKPVEESLVEEMQRKADKQRLEEMQRRADMQRLEEMTKDDQNPEMKEFLEKRLIALNRNLEIEEGKKQTDEIKKRVTSLKKVINKYEDKMVEMGYKEPKKKKQKKKKTSIPESNSESKLSLLARMEEYGDYENENENQNENAAFTHFWSDQGIYIVFVYFCMLI